MTVSGNLPLSVGFVKAAADYSANQFYGVKMDTNGDYELCDTAGEVCDGIIVHPAGAGEALGITLAGVEKVAAGAAVAAGDLLTIDATGRVITALSTNHVLGKAQSAASAAGELVTVVLKYSGVAP
jgi:hypothetical protein